MLTRHLYNGLSWIDLENPTRDDIKTLIDEYGIDPLVADELTAPTMRPKVELYKNYIYLILHFPAIRHSHNGNNNQEVDFIIGEDFIVTARYDAIDALETFAKEFEVQATLNKKELGSHAGYIFFHMIKSLYGALTDELDSIDDGLQEIESKIFKGKEKEMVTHLSQVSRHLLDFKKATSMHKDALGSLEFATGKIFGAAFQYYIRAILGEYLKVDNAIKANIESARELRETNTNLLQTKQNEIMKNFTILAFITFPFSLVVSILSLESPGNPFKNGTVTFWPVVFIILIAIACMFVYFKHKKWL